MFSSKRSRFFLNAPFLGNYSIDATLHAFFVSNTYKQHQTETN